METFNRRNFIKGMSSLAGAYLLSSCGHAQETDKIVPNPVLSPTELNFGAQASEQADRLTPPTTNQVKPQTWLSGELYTHVYTNVLMNSYTFDDGPSPYNTIPILRTLAKYGVKATFYVVGVNAQAWPEILQNIVDEGHEIGNHSVYHNPYESSALASQIAPNNQIIYNLVKVKPVSNRAPGLTKGTAILNACRAEGMYELHTHMDTNDWRTPRLDADKLVTEHMSVYKNGGVWLYHDGGYIRPTPTALPRMIDFDKSKGAMLLTATELINNGIPIPGRNVFGALEQSNESTNLYEARTQIGTHCNYDPKEELLTRLKDPKTKHTERSRIVGVLADIDKQEREG